MTESTRALGVGWRRDRLAARVADDIQDGWFVNLGIGLPTSVADHVPEGREIVFHSENGILGVGPAPAPGAEDENLVNAGKQPITLLEGGSFFSQSDSFAMIRGGHLDAAVLGAFQVSSRGDLANWKLPGEQLGRVGGAMDLALGARRVFVVTDHVTKDGEPKLVASCTYPLTGAACVTRVYTNLGVFRPAGPAFLVEDLAPGVDLAVVRAATGAPVVDERPQQPKENR